MVTLTAKVLWRERMGLILEAVCVDWSACGLGKHKSARFVERLTLKAGSGTLQEP